MYVKWKRKEEEIVVSLLGAWCRQQKQHYRKQSYVEEVYSSLLCPYLLASWLGYYICLLYTSDAADE